MIIGPVVNISPDKFERLVENGIDHKALQLLKLQGGESASQHFLKGDNLLEQINERGRFQLETLGSLSEK